MLTNPGRPQYQDIIDEAWGDQVADMVVRRYPDAAARDADLAGIAPATLAGQLIAIVPAAGAPYFEQHDGAAFVPTAGHCLATKKGPAAQTDATGAFNVCSITLANAKKNRIYLVDANGSGYNTNAGNNNLTLDLHATGNGVDLGVTPFGTLLGGPNEWLRASIGFWFVPTQDGTLFVEIRASATAAAYRVPANSCSLRIVDGGPAAFATILQERDHIETAPA
jgi:hypothetical protein